MFQIELTTAPLKITCTLESESLQRGLTHIGSFNIYLQITIDLILKGIIYLPEKYIICIWCKFYVRGGLNDNKI